MTMEELAALEDEWTPKFAMDNVPYDRVEPWQMKVYEAWNKIFGLYVVEARNGDVEALKRALFLYWYSWAEPCWLSGICVLDDDLSIEVLGMVNNIVKNGALDIEFKWMISCYYAVADLYIDNFEGFDELKKISKIIDSDLWMEYIEKACFSGRGQMGNYWQSIQYTINEEGGVCRYKKMPQNLKNCKNWNGSLDGIFQKSS